MSAIDQSTRSLATVPFALVSVIADAALANVVAGARDVAEAVDNRSVSAQDKQLRYRHGQAHMGEAAALLDTLAWGATSRAVQLDLGVHATALTAALDMAISEVETRREAYLHDPPTAPLLPDLDTPLALDLHRFAAGISEAIAELPPPPAQSWTC